jgi:hypothetical protein
VVDDDYAVAAAGVVVAAAAVVVVVARDVDGWAEGRVEAATAQRDDSIDHSSLPSRRATPSIAVYRDEHRCPLAVSIDINTIKLLPNRNDNRTGLTATTGSGGRPRC